MYIYKTDREKYYVKEEGSVNMYFIYKMINTSQGIS